MCNAVMLDWLIDLDSVPSEYETHISEIKDSHDELKPYFSVKNYKYRTELLNQLLKDKYSNILKK